MKKFLIIIIILFSNASCYKESSLKIEIGMKKDELLNENIIGKDNVRYMKDFYFILINQRIYIIEFNTNNKVKKYDIVDVNKSMNTNKKNYLKELNEIDLDSALEKFGLPDECGWHGEYYQPRYYISYILIDENTKYGGEHLSFSLYYQYNEDKKLVNVDSMKHNYYYTFK